MKTSSKALLILAPSLAGVVAIWSVVTLAKSNNKAVPNLSTTAAQNVVMISASAVSVGCRPTDRIVAAGLVEPPGGIVRIGVHAQGVVKHVPARPGMIVRKGDPLLILDQRAARAKLEIHKRDLAIARTRLASRLAESGEIQEDVEVAEAYLDEKLAELSDASLLSEMASQLNTLASQQNLESVVSKQETVRRQNLVKQVDAKVRQAKAAARKARRILQAHSSHEGGRLIRMERAKIAKVLAEVEAANTAISLLTVTAPSNGTVYQVNVRPGEHTGVDGDALILMGGGSELNVKVDIEEADFSRFDVKLSAVASRRGSEGNRHDLSLIRLRPIVMPKKRLSGRPEEKEDSRVFQVLYRLKRTPFFPGEVVDVFINPRCRRNQKTTVHTARHHGF